jgi:hypothetical protein
MTIRRLKTYTGSQGYVYQYYFVGQRPGARGDAREYIFDVTSDRKTTYPITLTLPREAVVAWAELHGRELSDSEQYAAVKMRLFRAFDEVENMRQEGRQLLVDAGFLNESLTALGVD